jgi:uncharacterized protein
MATQRLTHVLCAADPAGSAEAIERLAEVAAARDAQAICIVGDLHGSGGLEGYRAVFRALGRTGVPAFWVPGAADAPIGDYLREAYNSEVVHPLLRGVHGTVAFAGEHVIFAGFGGEVSDDPAVTRDEVERLRYPRWEPEYRLKVLRELDEHDLVLAFSTSLAHKGSGRSGSEALTELAGTYRPRLVVCGGERGSQLLGRSLIVSPGRLADGHFAVADIYSREVELGELSGVGA